MSQVYSQLKRYALVLTGREKKAENPINTKNEDEKQHDRDDDVDEVKEDDNDDDIDETNPAVNGNVSKEELAERIYNTITSTILPQLHRCVTKKVSLYHEASEEAIC